ncbi:TetR/AcrR family transcriptional regulator [Roseibium sp. RKSG952]|uniref:TetR/AcrR family transcriptional regulator n=1 Tax=Roseibium sp. RKSG952 TaxID=2529384 RepID=UPI0012BB6C27|nr:TetR/AcrR family transcriptional regulator [Roseibium sp. RKSG952]MTH95969.1 TetR/AcrR family transcriptional regulator [Roseibium sp. RKSG952]
MIDFQAITNVNPREILAVFAQNGFRKTSMEDIASAVSLSRQSIYKKFGSKEACYVWCAEASLSNMYGRVFAAMEEDAPPMETLERVFELANADSIDLINTPFGAETLEHVLKISFASEEDWTIRYRSRLGAFLFRHGYAASRDEGLEVAFTLIVAARGLLMMATSKDDFQADMRRICKSVLERSGS